MALIKPIAPLGTVKMASRKNLSENEIQNLLLEVRDKDEVFLGDELEDELDEIIPDFRDEQVPVEEDGSNHETDLESSEEEIEEDIVQRKQYKSDRPIAFQSDDDDDNSVPTSIRPSFVRDVTVTELKALFGLYYLAGGLKINHLSVKEIFDKIRASTIFGLHHWHQ
ncbi:unnamed protein product [Parnassius apollo]|uniref:(apollo) hypothetical protein n=1 Tax=Parnassius apollo TaxID=110799 RepID=A0A8S3WXH3_PARAO|nr:unnamed protein product [Parnassius apollo]